MNLRKLLETIIKTKKSFQDYLNNLIINVKIVSD